MSKPPCSAPLRIGLIFMGFLGLVSFRVAWYSQLYSPCCGELAKTTEILDLYTAKSTAVAPPSLINHFS